MSYRLTHKELMEQWQMDESLLAEYIYSRKVPYTHIAARPSFLTSQQWHPWKKLAKVAIADGDIEKSLKRTDFNFKKMMDRSGMFKWVNEESGDFEQNTLSALIAGIKLWLPFLRFDAKVVEEYRPPITIKGARRFRGIVFAGYNVWVDGQKLPLDDEKPLDDAGADMFKKLMDAAIDFVNEGKGTGRIPLDQLASTQWIAANIKTRMPKSIKRLIDSGRGTGKGYCIKRLLD